MSGKCAFIDAQYAQQATANARTIAQMIRRLSVSKSGYYEWLNRLPSDAQMRRLDAEQQPGHRAAA